VIGLRPRDGAPGAQAAECAGRCFDEGIRIRSSGDTLVLSPLLIIAESKMEMVFAATAARLKRSNESRHGGLLR
jgi:beta-alanine--pyruvate transaminase